MSLPDMPAFGLQRVLFRLHTAPGPGVQHVAGSLYRA
jgi:hypothetical protein